MQPVSILPAQWVDLRRQAAEAGRLLQKDIFEAAWDIFLQLYASGNGTPTVLTPEYSKSEFLLVVDTQGQPSGTQPELVAQFRSRVRIDPRFSLWFRESSFALAGEGAPDHPPGIQPVLLAARWFSHLAGLRHRTVEIFIDPPGMENHTLVQVRGLDKADSPGAFDLPCAGHADGTDGIVESLRKELGEELNLHLDDLDSLKEISRYLSKAAGDQARLFINEEFRVLFRGRLKPEAAGKVAFLDGEVAGLALFQIDELRRYCQRFPERIASGLYDSLPYYL